VVKPFHVAILVSWLGLTIIAAVFFIVPRLTDFDPQHKLLNLPGLQVMKQIKLLPQLRNTDLSNSLIHFTSKGCQCRQFTVQHKQQIDAQAAKDSLNIINIELDQSSIVPSTPAIAIVDKRGELMYLGPYSKGLSCTKSAGYVELVMNNYRQGFNTRLIVSQAQGCYCHIS